MFTLFVSGAILIVIFSAIAGIHFFWAAGGTWGISAALPARAPAGADTRSDQSSAKRDRLLFSPGRLTTVAVASVFLAGATGCAALLGVPELRRWQWGLLSPTVGAYAGAILFLLRAIGEFQYVGITKRIRGTDFAWWDDRLFTPLCFLISGCLYLFATALTAIE